MCVALRGGSSSSSGGGGGGSMSAPKISGRLQHDGQAARQTPFWICSTCNNMLYPKEDKARRVLMRICRNCGSAG